MVFLSSRLLLCLVLLYFPQTSRWAQSVLRSIASSPQQSLTKGSRDTMAIPCRPATASGGMKAQSGNVPECCGFLRSEKPRTSYVLIAEKVVITGPVLWRLGGLLADTEADFVSGSGEIRYPPVTGEPQVPRPVSGQITTLPTKAQGPTVAAESGEANPPLTREPRVTYPVPGQLVTLPAKAGVPFIVGALGEMKSFYVTVGSQVTYPVPGQFVTLPTGAKIASVAAGSGKVNHTPSLGEPQVTYPVPGQLITLPAGA